jgi:hypothetical protein
VVHFSGSHLERKLGGTVNFSGLDALLMLVANAQIEPGTNRREMKAVLGFAIRRRYIGTAGYIDGHLSLGQIIRLM